MKFVIQRVKEASVKVNNEVVGAINNGILVFIGFKPTDNKQSIPFAVNKLLSLRLWDDDKNRRWACGIKDKKYSILLVSQFTLYSILKGNKPDFHNAMSPDSANELYEIFLNTLKTSYDKVESGKFGAMMEVSLINDGPVTIEWEYPEEKLIASESFKEKQKEDLFSKQEKEIEEDK